jgi:hypothetical protein
MYCLFQTAINYNPRQGDIFDVAAWHPTAIQEYFLTYTWQGYRFDNLPTRQFVGIDKWNITSIGPYFLYNTLYG